MSTFVQAVLVFIIGLILYEALIAVGVPAWVLMVALLTLLIFFRPILWRVTRGLRALGDGWPRRLADWLVHEEGLEHDSPRDHEAAADEREARIREEVGRRVQDAAETARWRGRREAMAEALFDQYAETALFLVPEAEGHRQSRSHIGGVPHLPEGMDWLGQDEHKLHFLAALHLDEMPDKGAPEALPRSGVLFFFLDMEDMVSGAVLYAAQEGAVETPVPDNLMPLEDFSCRTGSNPATLMRTTFRMIPGRVAAPPHDALQLDPETGDRAKGLYTEFREAGLAAYGAAIQIHSRQGTLRPCTEYYENLVGGPKIVSANNEGGSGLQLLRLDSAHEFGLMFGDCGVVEFRIGPEDARQGRWERAYVVSGSC